MKLGQGRQAFSIYSKVEEISPDNIQALVNLAKFYFLNKALSDFLDEVQSKLSEKKNLLSKILEIVKMAS